MRTRAATRGLLGLALTIAWAHGGWALMAQQPAARGDALELLRLANQSRAQAGLPSLRWDANLAAAAYDHALRMAAAGPIAHRYGGEPDLPERAAAAGARFSRIEENVAFGPSPAKIHAEWMQSPGHHANLMSPDVDRVGVAVVDGRGGLYAVADYARAVEPLTPAEVEATVGAILQERGMALLAQAGAARQFCAQREGAGLDLSASLPANAGAKKARFGMRWQSAEIAKLPQELERALATGRYAQAAVASCELQADGGAAGFAAYRVAVLLF